MRTDPDPPTLSQTDQLSSSVLPMPRRPVRWTSRIERMSRSSFVWPAVLALLLLSIFPLITSLYLSLARFDLARGGYKLTFVGLNNYRKLLIGSERTHVLGLFAPSGPLQLIMFGLVVVALAVYLGRYLRSGAISFGGMLGRALLVAGSAALAWMVIHTFGPGGRLGTLSVTLVFVFVGIAFQYTLGLGLALITAQQLPGRRFFRVVFLLPMMITPVGVAYMFRDGHRYGEGAAHSAMAGVWPGRFLLGDRSMGRASCYLDRRYLAMDAVHVHRAGCGAGEPVG